jgi:hypothetical protein
MWMFAGAVTVRVWPPAWVYARSIVRVAWLYEWVVLPWSDRTTATMSDAVVLAARVTVNVEPNSIW